MATLFECPECDFSTWAEREDEAVAAAEDHLAEHGASDEGTVRSGLSVMPSPARSKSGPEAILDERRRRAGRRAADELVEDGMTVGLGTGSTTGWAIARVGERMAEESLDVRGVPTSLQAHELAVEVGVPLVSLDQVETLDVAIDGADQYHPTAPHVVKGGGGAHAREKAVDATADRFVVATSEDKAADPLDFPVPLSVLPESREQAKEWVRDLGAEPELRYAERKDGPVFTANGNLILDCDFGGVEDPVATARDLAAVPASQEHGLFVDMVDDVYVGTAEDVDVIQP